MEGKNKFLSGLLRNLKWKNYFVSEPKIDAYKIIKGERFRNEVYIYRGVAIKIFQRVRNSARL